MAVKADGLARGKGVIVCGTVDESDRAIDAMLVEQRFGRSGATIVVEERLEGPELSLLAITDGIDAALAMRAASHVLAWPKHFGLDGIVVPAVKRLLQANERRGPALDVLHSACVAHLKQRIAEPLEAPRDWTRPSQLGCKCQHCAELSRFLADPSREDWTLRAAQQIRSHVEDEVRAARADIDCQTLRRGSPHSLICRKNQASYRRRVAQRKQDLADMAVLCR